jgi:predicted phosphodiesterase
MKIDIFSDIHLDHWMAKVYQDRRARAVLREFIRAGRSDASTVIFAGDGGNGIHWYEAILTVLNEEYDNVIATPGNHDFYRTPGYTKDWFTAGNATEISREREWAEITEVVSYAACPLWTNFRDREGFGILAMNSISDWLYVPELVEGGWDVTHKEYYKYRDKLKRSKPEIAVTHFPPIVQSVHPMYAGQALNTYFCNDDEEMFVKMEAKLWVHGHTHSEMDYRHNGTRVVAHPIGYPFENYSELIGIPMKTVEL